MTFSEFKANAILGSEKYYNFLEQNGKGLAAAPVRSVQKMQGDQVKLFLTGRLASTDDVQIKIHNRIYTQEEIFPVRYDKDERSLLLRMREPFCELLLNANPRDIQVIADLKFLVQRVEKRFRNLDTPLRLPVRSPAIHPVCPALNAPLSDEQAQAYEGIFQSPVSYVWGAPGTGKTQFVLARAVLSYCLSGKKVLITAPTNNSVEQTLRGVLAVLDEAGVPLDKVLRLGTPSKEFYDAYPMVCEVRSVEDEMEKLGNDLDFYEKALKYHEVKAWHLATKERLEDCTDKISAYQSEQNTLQANMKRDRELLEAKTAKFAPLFSQIKLSNTRRDEILAYLGKKRSGIGKWLSRATIDRVTTELSELDNSLSKLGTEYDALFADTSALKEQIHMSEQRNEAILESIKEWIIVIKQLPKCPIKSDYATLVLNLSPYSSYGETLRKMRAALADILTSLESRSALYETVSREKAVSVIEEIEQRMDYIKSQSVSSRLTDCMVVAATLDGFISKLSDNEAFVPAHVFLDEAAYCPLIKCAALLSTGVPLTLLGDHKQLPPVCEASEQFLRDPENEPVSLWALSALYIGDAFSKSMSALSCAYENADEPDFSLISKYDLVQTYRFGPSLADVLDQYVYHSGFCGNPSVGTNISFVSVRPPRDKGAKQRSNENECIAIRELIQESSLTDYAVLTPYRAQRELLTKKYVNVDDVYTVHGSQGREWDTVILSVVETTQSWFLSPVLINTAVSRAKQRLILVCDAEYWKYREDHIIGGLIASAEPYQI